MNKIININLAGRLLPIDEAAYSQLTVYLNWLKQYFSKEKGGAEICSDMEDRIAELFEDKIRKGSASICTEDVQSVIQIMGNPEQIARESGENFDTEESMDTAPPPPQSGFISKHLSRNGKDKILGGVCSGIADYINLDVSVVRILFAVISLYYGAGFLLYIILWAVLPITYNHAVQLKKRLYRDPDGKVLGGVCKGLSAYLNMSVNWTRILFAAPLFGIIFFNIINENDLASFSTAAFPTMTLLYLVLWVILPQAKTVTERMELRGEKLDIPNLSAALKQENTSAIHNTKTPDSIFRTLIKIVAYGMLSFLVLILGIVFISLFLALLGTLLGVTTFSALSIPFSKVIFEYEWQQRLFYIAAFLGTCLPIIAIIRWVVNLLRKRRNANKWVGYSLGICWLLSVFCLFYIGGGLLSDFRKEYKVVEKLNFVQPADTLIIAPIEDSSSTADVFLNDIDFIRELPSGEMQFAAVSLNVIPSEDSLYHYYLIRQSNGADVKQAQKYASSIPFHYKQQGNVISLPEYIGLGGVKTYRGQLLTIQVQVPKGKVFKTGSIPPSFSKSWKVSNNNKSYNVRISSQQRWLPNTLYKMEDDGSVVAL